MSPLAHESDHKITPPPRSDIHPSHRKDMLIFLGGVTIGAILGSTGFAAATEFELITPPAANQNNVQLSSATTSQILEQANYEDGTYVADAIYTVPATNEQHTLRVTVVVENAEIVATSAVEVEDGEEVVGEYLQKFNDELTTLVIGKPIDDIQNMELVSGSTITSDAFKQAVAEVQAEAAVKDIVSDLYVDGEYYHQTFFPVPELGEGEGHWIAVTLTLDQGIVTNVIVQEVTEAGEPITNERFDEFDTAVETEIVGKPLTDALDLAIINGSSYTTDGFNEAISEINRQALLNEAETGEQVQE